MQPEHCECRLGFFSSKEQFTTSKLSSDGAYNPSGSQIPLAFGCSLRDFRPHTQLSKPECSHPQGCVCPEQGRGQPCREARRVGEGLCHAPTASRSKFCKCLSSDEKRQDADL